MGQTSVTLRKRISEHVPKCLLDYQKFLNDGNGQKFDDKRMGYVNNAAKRSSVCQHLASNLECLKNYDAKRFRPIAQARNSFHLSVLEAVIISQDQPDICKQKDFTYRTLLF